MHIEDRSTFIVGDSCVTSHYYTPFLNFSPKTLLLRLHTHSLSPLCFHLHPFTPSNHQRPPPQPRSPFLFWFFALIWFTCCICYEFVFSELTVPSFPCFAYFSCNKLHTTLLLFYFSAGKQNTARKKGGKKQVNLFKVNLFCCLSWSPFKKYPSIYNAFEFEFEYAKAIWRMEYVIIYSHLGDTVYTRSVH